MISRLGRMRHGIFSVGGETATSAKQQTSGGPALFRLRGTVWMLNAQSNDWIGVGQNEEHVDSHGDSRSIL
jgi:hypothetical protein